MKPSVERILNYLKAINKFEYKEIRNKAVSNGWEMEFQEYLIEDAIGDLDYLIDLIENAIETKSLDAVSVSRRNQIISYLENLASVIPNILNNNENRISQFIQEVDRLRDELRLTNLDLETNKFPSYAKKRQELNKLIKEYIDLNNALKDALYTKKEIENLQNEVLGIKDQLVNKNNEATNISNNLNSIDQDIIAKNTQLQTSFDIANQYLGDINKIKGEIETFHGTIDSKSTELTNIVAESNDITLKHKHLEDQITDLLSKATGNNLFQAFQKRSEKLEERIVRWILGIALSIVAIALVGIWIAIGYQSTGAVDGWFIFKLFITSPFIYSLLFFSRQFGTDRKLQEEYAFKSTLSLSLPAYREELHKISKQEEGRAENIRLMENTLGQIFTSPTENLFKNHIPESEEAVVDIYKLAESFVKGVKP